MTGSHHPTHTMLQPRKNLILLTLAVLVASHVEAARQCPQGWFYFNTKCYFYSASTADWNTAKDICATRGAVLATLGSAPEAVFLSNQAKAIGNGKTYYLGATDKASEGKWINVGNQPFVVDKSIWGKGQPDNYGKAEHCLSFGSFDKYKLNDAPCSGSYNYICERHLEYVDPCDSENGWHLVKGKCYHFYKEPTSWPEARQICQDNGADLLTINNSDELGLVSESVSCDNTSPMWLGYSDINAAKSLQWVDNLKPDPSVTRWDTKNGEPDSSKYAKGNNCAASITMNKNMWELTNCVGNDMAFICEKGKGQCPRGWKNIKGICYKSIFIKKTWPQAKLDCEGFGGSLASPITLKAQKGVVGNSRTTFWIGITDRGSDGQFKEIDGNAVPTSLLKTQKPNKQGDCGTWRAAKAGISNCYKKINYICAASMGAIRATPTSAPSDGTMCLPGWVKYKSSCYKTVGKAANYLAAKVVCSNMNQATLLIINDQAEQDFLAEHRTLLNNVNWIGLDDLKSSGNYQWVDSSPTTFTNWRGNEPNKGREHCAEMQRRTYSVPASWNNIDCKKTRPFICEAKSTVGIPVTTVKPTRPWSRECGQGWTVDHLSGSCYYFSLDRKNWKDARKACQKMKSDLMSVESKYEQSFFQGILRSDTSGALAYWVGGNDLDIELGWRWTDGKPFKYWNWNDGEPNSAGNEDCIEVVRQNGRWNDNRCTNSRNYACERHSVLPTKPSAYGTTPLPSITADCKATELISGEHWVPDSALTASSVKDKDSGPANSRIDWTATDVKIKISTTTQYRYKGVANLNLKGAKNVRFTVMACNDAHISLQPQVDNITRDAYEVVLGGWKNTQSVIRSEHQGAVQVKVRRNDLLDCKSAKPFWISWGTGKIQVGTGYQITGSALIMELAVKDSLTIAGMAVSTGWNAKGNWIITNPHGTRQGAWSPKYRVKNVPIGTEQYIYGQWLQVDFAKPTLIQSVTTKGSATSNEYVVEYYIEYSYDSPYEFQSYTKTSSKVTMYFPGNKDANTAVTNKIPDPFEAQYVRIRPRKFISSPSLRWALNGCPPPKYCNPERLVTGVSRVEDWSIRASSLQSGSVYDSRLVALPGKPAPKGWLANAPNVGPSALSEEWIQIYLRRDMLIHGIVTKGHAERKYWVKSYQVQTKTPTGGYALKNYQEPYGTVKVFTANRDQNTEVVNMFKNPVIATYIRILPKEFNTAIGMRIDILGCLEGCSLSSMINGPNPLSDVRLSASSSLSAQTGPTRARLDTTGFGGAWVPKVAKGSFFQIDFGIKERISAITTQGRSDKDQWVTYFTLGYTLDGKNYYMFYSRMRFSANVDRNTKRKNFFPRELVAQGIRIYPAYWKDMPALRVELHGCSGSSAKYIGCFTEGSHLSSFDGPVSYNTYNSPNKCAASCFKDGYMYAGLNRNTCKCGSRLPVGGRSTRCNYKCRGNTKLFCGGYGTGVISVYETGIGPDDERCPSGYETFNNKCFKISQVKQTWQDARKSCLLDGGDLATINSVAEQAYLKTKLQRLRYGVWIGLNDLQDQMSFEWVDGTPVRATFWMHSEPNNWLGKNEDCVEAISYTEMAKGYKDSKLYAQNGLWNDRKCEEARYSMCQRKKERMDPATMTTVTPPQGCPFGWKAYQSSCYLMIEHRSNWAQASYTCQKEGGTLVRVNDEFEQNFLTTELYKRTGYTLTKGVTRYWIDLREDTNNKDFVWSNNWDVIPYTHWAQGQPVVNSSPNPLPWNILTSSSLFMRNCVAMNGQNEKSTGYWASQKCVLSQAFPLCERPRTGYKQPALPTRAPEDIICPVGWVGVGPNCYQVNTPTDPLDMKMWVDAEQHCVKQGAHLAYINNGTENEHLWRNFLLKPGSDSNRFWIGLNDRASNKGYKWVSGDAFSYSNWKVGEPNDWDGLEPCAMLDGADGLWNDEKCHLPMNWICSLSRSDVKKIRTVVTTPEPTAGPLGSCADGDDWKSFNKHCYFLNTDEMTFRDANAFCNSKGAHLVSIQSSIENSFVRSISKGLVTQLNGRSASRANLGGMFTQIWTGLNELDRSKGHRWSDGSSFKFSNWAENEPNDYNGGEYCVGMYVASGEWNDGHCSAKIPSVCEKNPNQIGEITTKMPPHIDGFCPTGYMAFENDCYKIVVDKPLNWTTAETTCNDDGGHLASVMNSREQTFLTSQLKPVVRAKMALWLGLQHGSATKSSFFSHATSYLWTSNQDISFTNWNHGEPNGLNKEACTEMLYNPAGRWNDVACTSVRGYICKKPKDGSVTTPPKEDNSRCSPGYTYWEDSCYKYVSTKGPWSYLDGSTCGADAANLVSIQDPYEYAFIRTWMWKQKVTDLFWIGLKSQANTNSFSWSNQWPLVVTYWGPKEPGNFKAKEGCVYMDSGNGEDDGKWVHTLCNNMYSAICKKPLDAPPYAVPSNGICQSAAGENWVANTDGYCYLFNIDPRYTFDDAEGACRTAGAQLASIHSDADSTFISTQMEHMDAFGGNGGTKNVWIGLKKVDAGGFVWTDNSAVGYAHWADNEPNSVENSENCTEAYSPDSDWNDVSCQSKRGFICKIKQGYQPRTFPTPFNSEPTTLPTTTRRNSPCQLDGWKFYNGSCYLMVSQTNQFVRWNEAEDYCKAPGREGKLASIQSEAENQWIVDNLLPSGIDGDAWLGMAELQRDNRLRWTDNSKISYINWNDNQPLTNTGSMECVAMSIASGSGASGRWSTEYCFAKKAFICEIDAKKKISVTVGTQRTDGSLCHFPFKYRGQDFTTCTTYGSSFLWCATSDHYDRDGKFAICDPFRCPPGWRRHERMCYYFSTAVDKRSWLDAERACAVQGADLGFIGSAEVESFITDNINEYFWIGLNDRAIEGRMNWDHRPKMIMVRGFTNFGLNEPRNGFGTEDCAQIVNGPYADGRPGEWVMANCDLPRRYVCMKNAAYTLNMSTPVLPSNSPSPSQGGVSNSLPTPTVSGNSSQSLGGSLPNKNAQKSPVNSPDTSALRTGEITAIVIACLALVLAAVFIFLYVRRVRPSSQDDSLKSLGFDNASYSRSNDSVHVGLENPNFSAN